MLRLIGEERHPDGRLTRRELLRIGGLIGLGSSLAKLAPSRAAEKSSHSAGFGKAKSVIVVFANGGQSQLETWDPKPEAPQQIRGDFQAIRTSVPGTLLCEHMPRLAGIADKFTIVRSMAHADLDHGSAFYLSMTGRYHRRRSSNVPPSPTDSPTTGAILKRVRPNRQFVHSSIHLNGPAQVPELIGPGQFGGFLGRDYDPMLLGDVTAGTIVVPGLATQEELPQVRLRTRQRLVEALDAQCRRFEQDRAILDMSVLYRQAFQMLAKPSTRQAFDLSAESTVVRDRYGRNRSGQACLLARRLVEVGVPLTTVFFNHRNRGQDKQPGVTNAYGWDTHNDIFQAMKVHLLPRFDQGLSALLEDLDERGLMEETLVICLGEFGRAPRVALEPTFAGSSPGRKHWAAVYSIVMAGAGVGRGKVLGKSDRRGAFPRSEKYGPWDVTATIFSALGIDPAGHYTDPTGQPFAISTGKPIEGLYTG